MINSTRRWRDAMAIVGVALAIRLAIIAVVPYGYVGDVRGWMEAAQFVTAAGYRSAYAEALQGNNYPPLFLLFLWVVGHAYQLCCSPQFDWPTRTLDILIRIGPAVADSLLALLVYCAAAPWSSRGWALLAGLAYAFNPAALANAAWYSMVGDPFYVLLVFMSFLTLLKERFAGAIGLMVLAVFMKPQAVMFIPLVGFWVWLNGQPRRLVVAMGVAVALAVLIYLPFVLGDTITQAIKGIARMASGFPFLHVKADNLWYLLSLGRDPFGVSPPYDTNVLLGLIRYRDVGLIAFGLLNAIALCWLIGRQSAPALFAVASLLGLGFFVLSTQMHVNYSYPVFALLCALLPLRNRRLACVLGMVTVASLVDWLPAGVPLHLANSIIYVASFAILLVAVRSLLLSGPAQSLQAWQISRLEIVKWAFLIGGCVLIVGALMAWMLPWEIPVLSEGRLCLLLGTMALLMCVALERVKGTLVVQGNGAL